MARYLFSSAKGGNVAAQIFWLKTRVHWHEGSAPSSISDCKAEPNSPVALVLPDNGRDPELTKVLLDAQNNICREAKTAPS